MSLEWKSCKIGDLGKIFSGGTPSTKIEEYWNGNLNWLSSGETRNTYIYSTDKYITEKGAENSSTKLANKGDIVIASAGQGFTRGQSSMVMIDTFVNQSVIVIHPNEKVNNHYLLYNLKFRYPELRQLSDHASTRGSLTTKIIKGLDINLPDLNTQNKIATIIQYFDKKIETDKRINKNLHLLSKNIFKYYMEDFCPFLENGMQNSELGNIPIDWKVHDFNSIADIFNGYSYKGNELQPSNSAMATIKNFNRDGSFRSDGFKEIVYSEKIKEQHFVNENDVLVSCTDVTQDADIIGNCVLLLDKQGYNEVIMSMDLVKVESKIPEINNFLLAAILKSYRFKMHILGYVNGTTVLHLDKKGIKKFRLALPSDLSILKDLSNIMEQIYNQISINMKEINNLTKLRDTLLPKLMSGEIDVSKINCDLE